MLKTNKRCLIVIVLLILHFLMLTGCWSSNEAEEMGLVIGTAIDLDENSSGGEKRLLVTNQIITSSTAGSGSGTQSSGTSQQKAYKNITETGSSIFSIVRNMAQKLEQQLFAQHIKVIVVGEEVARRMSLQEITNFFNREMEVRPSCLILIAKNEASQTLDSNDPTVIPAFYLNQIAKNLKRSVKILPPVTLTNLNENINSDTSFLLQSIIKDKDDVKFSGAAVIEGKSNQLLGFLNEKELEGATWLTGEGKGGLVEAKDKKDADIIYEIQSMDSKIQPIISGDNISFNVKIESEGRIGEYQSDAESLFNNKFLKEAEDLIEKEVHQLVKEVLNKTQKEYQVDVLGFGNALRIEKPKLWNRVKGNWDSIFSEVSINVDIKINIKDYGISGS